VGNTSSCLAAGEVATDVVLEVENVFFRYDSTHLLRGVSLEVRRGEAEGGYSEGVVSGGVCDLRR